MSVVAIGRCVGCAQTRVLQEGGCEICLARRGQRWLRLAAKVRSNPAFAAAVLSAIRTEAARRKFITWLEGPVPATARS